MDRVDDPAEEQEQEGLKGAFTLVRRRACVPPAPLLVKGRLC